MKYHIQHPQVFQINPPICKVSIQCIAEHLEVTRFMNYKDRNDYFYSNGIDYDNVKKYYDKVLKLNTIIINKKQ